MLVFQVEPALFEPSSKVPPETETVLAVVLPGAATAVKKHVRPPQGYAPFVSDFFKVSIFDTESVPIAGEVKVELYVPWPLISNARTGEKAKEISKSQIRIFPNFLGLVLGCIEAKFCK